MNCKIIALLRTNYFIGPDNNLVVKCSYIIEFLQCYSYGSINYYISRACKKLQNLQEKVCVTFVILEL